MWTKQKRKTETGRYVLFALTVLIVSYFGYHYYHGEYGLASRREAEVRIKFLIEERTKLEEQSIKLERKIAALQDGTIEKDMLDEYIRKNLDFSRPNELIILLKEYEKNMEK